MTLGNGQTQTYKIKTEPYRFNEAHHTVYSRVEKGYLDNSLMFMMGQLNSKWVAYDRMGDVRWYTTAPFAFAMRRLKNGNYIAGSCRFMANPYMTTGLMEFNLTGKILCEYRIPGGYHHDQVELPDGDLIVLTQLPNGNTKEDVAVRIDRKTGEIKQEWDFKNYLPQDVARTGHASAYDWFHNNAVAYDERTNSLLFSGRHQSAIISISLDTNQLNWILGSPEGWPQEMIDQYFFTPVGDTKKFEWPSEQHSVVIAPDGDIMCFDNGDFRSKDPKHFLAARDSYSRGVKYRLDTEKMQVEQVWQYGKERGAEFYSSYIGNVGCLGEDHYIIHSGGIAYHNGDVSEIMGSRLGRSAEKIFAKLYSITVVEKKGKIMYESIVPANMYRGEEFPVYGDNEAFTAGKGRSIGSLGRTPQISSDGFALDEAAVLPDCYELSARDEGDRYDINGMFSEGDDVIIILNSMREQLAYHLKTKIPPLTMKEGADRCENGRRNFWIYINKEGINPDYELYLSVNGNIYKTDIICR